MNRHHDHMYLVGLQSRSSRCYPLGVGYIYPLEGSSLGTLCHHLGYPQDRGSLGCGFGSFGYRNLGSGYLGFDFHGDRNLGLVSLVWVGLLTSTLVTLVLLVVAHQVRGCPRRVVSLPGFVPR